MSVKLFNEVTFQGEVISIDYGYTKKDKLFCRGKIESYQNKKNADGEDYKAFRLQMRFICFNEDIAINMQKSNVEKGDIIKINGNLNLNKFNDTYYTQILINDFNGKSFEIIEKADDFQNDVYDEFYSEPKKEETDKGALDDLEDDLPF